jgi:hypothetical protein
MAEPVSTAATATATAKLFQTTLLVLYFTTPATITIPKDYFKTHLKTDYEATKIWTLQSTSQIPVEDPDMCVAQGEEYIRQFNNIGTVTVRAYCMCPRADSGNNVCHAQQEAIAKLQENQEQVPTAIGTIIQLGPGKTQVPIIPNPRLQRQ